MLLTFILVSCSKENLQDINSTSQMGVINSCSNIPMSSSVDLNAARKIAGMHNQYLDRAFKSGELNKTRGEYDVINVFKQLDRCTLNKKALSAKDRDLVLKNILSAPSYQYLNNAFALCEDLDKRSYSYLNSAIDSIELLVSNNVKDPNEKLAVLTGLAVLDSSAYFWMPENMGGSGVGFGYIQKSTGFNSVTLRVSGEWLLADAESATIGMFYVAVAGAVSAGTATPGALVGVAVTSAAASAVAALKSWW